MAIQGDKLMNLADGKVLYDDLRDRVEGKLDAPSTAGTQGQVLTSDGHGGQSWEDPSGGTVTDVQVNGTSVVNSGVANVPVANMSTVGAFKTENYKGFVLDAKGNITVDWANSSNIKAGASGYKALAVSSQHISTFYGLAKAAGDTTQSSSANAVGTYTETALSKISDMLNAPVSVSGTTPSITAKAGIQYICGECSTLAITLPVSGCIDVTFESGSTATVLTITPPTGVTVKWANGFDPTSLDANTTYEINIMDGLGVAVSWT